MPLARMVDGAPTTPTPAITVGSRAVEPPVTMAPWMCSVVCGDNGRTTTAPSRGNQAAVFAARGQHDVGRQNDHAVGPCTHRAARNAQAPGDDQRRIVPVQIADIHVAIYVEDGVAQREGRVVGDGLQLVHEICGSTA